MKILTNMAIKHLQKKDYLIIHRGEAQKDSALFKLLTTFMSHLNRYNKNVIPNSN